MCLSSEGGEQVVGAELVVARRNPLGVDFPGLELSFVDDEVLHSHTLLGRAPPNGLEMSPGRAPGSSLRDAARSTARPRLRAYLRSDSPQLAGSVAEHPERAP